MRSKQTNDLLSSGISPYRILVAAIFEQVIKDAKKENEIGKDAKDFLESDYANELLQLANIYDFV